MLKINTIFLGNISYLDFGRSQERSFDILGEEPWKFMVCLKNCKSKGSKEHANTLNQQKMRDDAQKSQIIALKSPLQQT
jgi:hypothetical protein